MTTPDYTRFFSERRILIVDPCSGSLTSIQGILVGLGADPAKIVMASEFKEAEAIIRREKPCLIFSEYKLDSFCGIDLAKIQREVCTDKSSMFVIVTKEISHSVVSRAVEHDIDCYIIKPYTAARFKKFVLKEVTEKINPSECTQKIESGKTLLEKKDFKGAIDALKKAIEINPRSALAFYYLGKAYLGVHDDQEAEKSFRDGIAVNQFHYKCLVALYELLFQKKRNPEAYEIVKKIVNFFPSNPLHLISVINLSILTKDFKSVEAYYSNFLDIEEKNEELVRYISAALVVCGKYFLRSGEKEKSIQLFEAANKLHENNSKMLNYIIDALNENGLTEEAKFFINKQKSVDGA